MSLLPEIIIAEARSWLGTPYCHQASLKGVGCDCLGLVRGVYEAIIGEPSEEPGAYSPHWAETSNDDVLLEAAARHLLAREGQKFDPGDVVLFRLNPSAPAKHMAIISAPDRMIHAYEGAAVVETNIGPWWRRRMAGVFSFPERGAP